MLGKLYAMDRIMERKPSTSQPTHDGAHGYSEYFGCVLIGEAVHANHCDQRALLGSELIETSENLSEGEPVLVSRIERAVRIRHQHFI
jgi:hypothetical protein